MSRNILFHTLYDSMEYMDDASPLHKIVGNTWCHTVQARAIKNLSVMLTCVRREASYYLFASLNHIFWNQ